MWIHQIGKYPKACGKSDGYAYGYIAGQTDRSKNKEYSSAKPSISKDFEAEADQITYEKYFWFTWPTGYHDGYYGLDYYNRWED